MFTWKSCSAISLVLLLSMGAGCAEDDGVVPPDVRDATEPANVTDLGSGVVTSFSVQLHFTAPGDDGSDGTAREYDIRYSPVIITDTTFSVANQATNVPTPATAGTAETTTVTGLEENTTYYFALKTADEAQNWSGLSNIAVATTEQRLRQITDGVAEARHPVWSPDGSQIAFGIQIVNSFNSDIWTIPATGGTAIQITTDPASDANPSWSPDGTQIAFQSNRSGNWDIWIIPATGGTAVQVTDDPAHETSPAWSPDGSQIAFAADYSVLRNNSDIWTIPAMGGTAVQITTHDNEEGGPSWSPDGSQIAFSRQRGDWDIWTIPATGGTPVQITTHDAFDTGTSSCWSRDGSEIVFASNRNGNFDIWTIPVGGGTAVQITTDEARDYDPAWSPRDQRVVFVSDRSGVMNVWIVWAE